VLISYFRVPTPRFEGSHTAPCVILPLYGGYPTQPCAFKDIHCLHQAQSEEIVEIS
jgi:hypothetical protein